MFKKLVGLLTVAVAGLFLSGVAIAGIAGTAHDFSVVGGFNSGGELCIVCHTPHDSDAAVALEAPLWNHQLTSDTGWTMYSSDTLDNTIALTPNTKSKLCLSCHDGSVAMDNYGGVTSGTEIMLPANSAYVGKVLTAQHPISVTFDNAVDTGLHPPGNTVASLGGTISEKMLFGLGGDQVECSSCHSVHNDLGTGDGEAMLLIDNTGSAMCLTCHNK